MNNSNNNGVLAPSTGGSISGSYATDSGSSNNNNNNNNNTPQKNPLSSGTTITERSDQSVSESDDYIDDEVLDEDILESLDTLTSGDEINSLLDHNMSPPEEASQQPMKILLSNHFERWYPMSRDMIPKTQGTIFVCAVRDFVVVDGVELLRISVRGQSFLLQ
jgi:hypothetical protein